MQCEMAASSSSICEAQGNQALKNLIQCCGIILVMMGTLLLFR